MQPQHANFYGAPYGVPYQFKPAGAQPVAQTSSQPEETAFLDITQHVLNNTLGGNGLDDAQQITLDRMCDAYWDTNYESQYASAQSGTPQCKPEIKLREWALEQAQVHGNKLAAKAIYASLNRLLFSNLPIHMEDPEIAAYTTQSRFSVVRDISLVTGLKKRVDQPGNIVAQYVLGKMYLDGASEVLQSPEKGIKYLKMAAECGYEPAIKHLQTANALYQLGSLSQNHQDAIRYYQAAYKQAISDKDFTLAKSVLAQLKFYVPILNQTSSGLSLGGIFGTSEPGDNIIQFFKSAFDAAVSSNNVMHAKDIAEYLAEMYGDQYENSITKVFIETNPIDQVLHYTMLSIDPGNTQWKQKADNGDRDIRLLMARTYIKFGDINRAKEYFKLVLDANIKDLTHNLAAVALGIIYERQYDDRSLLSYGTSSLDNAIKFYEMSTDPRDKFSALRLKAIYGDHEIEFQVGKKYLEGDATIKLLPDPDQAAKYLRLAADSGHLDAAFAFSELNDPYKSLYAKCDSELARDYLDFAAAGGHKLAKIKQLENLAEATGYCTVYFNLYIACSQIGETAKAIRALIEAAGRHHEEALDLLVNSIGPTLDPVADDYSADRKAHFEELLKNVRQNKNNSNVSTTTTTTTQTSEKTRRGQQQSTPRNVKDLIDEL